jgi:hypothetical protein
MAKTTIPQKVQSALWARAAGRCEYRGCNKALIGDLVAGRQDPLFGFIAHIVADSPEGPRGDAERSPRLARDIENLMLMCATHHKLIDVDGVTDHPEDILLNMKAEHEGRIATVTGIDEDRASHVIRFGASIGKNEALVSTRAIFLAMPPDHHPATETTIDLEMIGSSFQDDEPEFWRLQKENLDRLFAAKVRGRIERQEIRHLSVFALAPQPLLIELGRLLYDIVPAVIHQRHREPQTWKWQPDQPPISWIEHGSDSERHDTIALKLAVSASITDDRIRGVLGDDVSIWSLEAENPHNDIVRSPEDQSSYRQRLRRLFNDIKAHHGENQMINVFPALPASLAVETGRVWMPKADLDMLIYDQCRGKGFIPTLTIGRT